MTLTFQLYVLYIRLNQIGDQNHELYLHEKINKGDLASWEEGREMISKRRSGMKYMSLFLIFWLNYTFDLINFSRVHFCSPLVLLGTMLFL